MPLLHIFRYHPVERASQPLLWRSIWQTGARIRGIVALTLLRATSTGRTVISSAAHRPWRGWSSSPRHRWRSRAALLWQLCDTCQCRVAVSVACYVPSCDTGPEICTNSEMQSPLKRRGEVTLLCANAVSTGGQLRMCSCVRMQSS